jgi:hypothetical protein
VKKHANLLLGALLCLPSLAAAADLPCGAAENGAVELDGLGDDWKDVDGIEGGNRDKNRSFTVKCNLDDEALYLWIDVRDNYFVRTARAAPGEDHLELTLSGKRLTIYPGDAAALKEKLLWGSRPAKGLRALSSLQPEGWAVELAIPRPLVPGWRKGAPSLSYRLRVVDCDSKASLKPEGEVELEGRITFDAGTGNLEAFLKERGLKRGDVLWERTLSLGGREGGQALLAGRVMALITDEGYLFGELPFRDRKDLKEVRAVDLAGDGREALLLRYVERGGGGAREVLAAYRFGTDRVSRVFAAEVGKSLGENKLACKVSFVRRGRATDIVLEALPPVGFTRDSYQESPADDLVPILLPWSDDKKAHFQFRGDEYARK